MPHEDTKTPTSSGTDRPFTSGTVASADLLAYDPFALDSLFEAVSGSAFTLDQTFSTAEFADGFIPESAGKVPQILNVGAFINAFANSSGTEILEWQNRLLRGGYLEEGQYRPGFYDQETQRAILFAVIDAQRQGASLFDVLRRAASAQKKADLGEKKKSLDELAQDDYRQGLLATYMKTWGTPPPPGYVERIAQSGMNIFEFEAHERAKPAFRTSPVYQEERLGLEMQLAEVFG